MVSAQMGTLTRKIERQPAAATSAPPATGPSATPSEPIAPHAPSARARCAGSGNWRTIRASEHGSSADAPRPWTARAAISTLSCGAAAQAAEPTANTARPTVNTRRAPTRSAVEPAVSMIEARASVYASTTHCSPASEPPISRWMADSATFTIVELDHEEAQADRQQRGGRVAAGSRAAGFCPLASCPVGSCPAGSGAAGLAGRGQRPGRGVRGAAWLRAARHGACPLPVASRLPVHRDHIPSASPGFPACPGDLQRQVEGCGKCGARALRKGRPQARRRPAG
jgi:hypothetical protein